MGKGGGAPVTAESVEARELARLQGKAGTELFQETSPLRQENVGQALTNLQGLPGFAAEPIGIDSITADPRFAALKTANESQFNLAREAVIGSTPRGGALTSALADVETGRARANTGSFAQLFQSEQQRREREVDRRLQQANLLGTGQTSQAISAVGQAGSQLGVLGANQAQLAAANAQASSQKGASTGQAIGQIGAAAFKRPS